MPSALFLFIYLFLLSVELKIIQSFFSFVVTADKFRIWCTRATNKRPTSGRNRHRAEWTKNKKKKKKKNNEPDWKTSVTRNLRSEDEQKNYCLGMEEVALVRACTAIWYDARSGVTTTLTAVSFPRERISQLLRYCFFFCCRYCCCYCCSLVLMLAS